LATLVTQKRFRSGLYYRINSVTANIPALRERREDSPVLIEHFVRRYATQLNRTITVIPRKTVAALCRHRWPGNIGELQNLIERAVILSPGPVLRVPLDDLRRDDVVRQRNGVHVTPRSIGSDKDQMELLVARRSPIRRAQRIRPPTGGRIPARCARFRLHSCEEVRTSN